MKVAIAPNALKSSLTATEAALAIKKGINEFNPDIETILIPVADGGDGLVDVLQGALGGELITCEVSDPLGRAIHAEYTYVKAEKTAAIEMALASGIALLHPDERNPLQTSTFGTGELIKDAAKRGAKKIILGIGGSATNDAGIGMAAALGVKFYDQNNSQLHPYGEQLGNISRIDMSGIMPEIKDISFEVACDVENPLYGENGAAHVYSRQKGANNDQVEFLDQGLKNFAAIVEQNLQLNIKDLKGAGAAGGLGAGLVAFTAAKLSKGIDLVFSAVKLEDKIKDTDLVFTAEGQIDFQTKFGKAPAGVAKIAQKHHIPCIALAGSVGEKIEELRDCGITAIYSLCQRPTTLEQAIAESAENMKITAKEVMYTFTARK